MSLFSSIFKSVKSKTDVLQLIENGSVIIDVRTPGEFKAGHIKESYNFPLNTLPDNLKILESFHRSLVLVCKSGGRSNKAKEILSESGIECYNGGAWDALNRKLHVAI